MVAKSTQWRNDSLSAIMVLEKLDTQMQENEIRLRYLKSNLKINSKRNKDLNITSEIVKPMENTEGSFMMVVWKLIFVLFFTISKADAYKQK